MKKHFASLALVGALLIAAPARAQLDQVFDQIFNNILRDKLVRSSGGILNPDPARAHGLHYFPAADLANQQLTPALNNLIAGNISSFPLSSTVAGVTFDFSSGRPVSISESLGPIFAETAATLGQSKINAGFNYTYLNFSKLRGIATKDVRFTFTHQELGTNNSLGDNPTESDYIDLFLDLNVDAEIVALFATYGITKNFDMGVAVPWVKVGLNGNAQAVINSYTFPLLGQAIHRFNADSLNPQLTDNAPYDQSKTGLGDVALRLKYSFLRGAGVDLAALVDVRFPTGKQKNFFGTGKTNARVLWIVSKKAGDFTPHLNLGYEKRAASFDSDKLRVTAGFDQKVANGITFAAEFLGDFALNRDETIKLFPGTVTITDTNLPFGPPTRPRGTEVRKISSTNVPDFERDNAFDVAFGFRAAPSESILLLGNIILPLNDGGLRSSVAPTIGATISF